MGVASPQDPAGVPLGVAILGVRATLGVTGSTSFFILSRRPAPAGTPRAVVLQEHTGGVED